MPSAPVAHAAVRREASLLRSVQFLLATADPLRTSPTANRGERAARRRAEVIEYLRVQDGAIRSDAGLVTRHIRFALGAGPGLSRLLHAMEREGLISREVRGRRTYAVHLATECPAAGRSATGPREEPAASGTAPVDFEQLAAALLGMVEKRLAVVDPDNRARVEQLEAHRATLHGHLAECRAAREDGTTDDPVARRAFIEQRLEQMTAGALEFERRSGARIDDAFTAAERESLRRLIPAIPARPVAPTT